MDPSVKAWSPIMSHYASRTPIRLRGKLHEVVGRLDTGLHHGEFVSKIHLEERLQGLLERRVVGRSVGCVVLLLLFGLTFNYSTRLPVPIDITNLFLVVMFLAGFLGIVRLAAAHLSVSPGYFQLHRRIALRGDHLLFQREGFDNELIPMADCYLQMGTFARAEELQFWACPEPVVLLVRPRCDRRMPESATPLCPLSVLRAEFAANPQGGLFSKLQIHERLEHDPNWIETIRHAVPQPAHTLAMRRNPRCTGVYRRCVWHPCGQGIDSATPDVRSSGQRPSAASTIGASGMASARGFRARGFGRLLDVVFLALGSDVPERGSF